MSNKKIKAFKCKELLVLVGFEMLCTIFISILRIILCFISYFSSLPALPASWTLELMVIDDAEQPNDDEKDGGGWIVNDIGLI